MNTTRQSALLTELYDTYSQQLYGYLRRLVGDAAHAEELLQDVYTRAFQALPGLNAESNYRAWLYRIATNAARDWHRRQKVRPWTTRQRDQRQEEEGDREDTTPSAEEPLPVEERLAVEDALRSLAPLYRMPLILFSVEGLSTSEIAQVLGISRSAVKMRLARARVQFLESYGASNETVDSA